MRRLETLLTCAFIALTTIGVCQVQTSPPLDLHDSVPFQGHPLLYNAVTIEHQDEEELREECDWPQLLRMIREIEQKLSETLEEEVYRNYTLVEISGSRTYMQYNCYALRDSIIALQFELDAALESEPTALTLAATDIASNLARLKGRIIDDGNLPLGALGFLYGTDSTLTDSINVPFGALQAVFDTSEVDTASFDIQVSDLARYTKYYFTAVGSNTEGAGYGDTLSFMTLPELATGLVVDTSGVTTTQALLKLSIADAGGQGPDSVGFFWHNTDFDATTAGVDSLPSDSTGGTNHSVLISGLTRYTDYYVNVYADNLAGRAMMNDNFIFKTLPEIPTFALVEYRNAANRLFAEIDDDGGQAPTSVGFEYADNSALSSSSTVSGELVVDSIFGSLLESSLTAGKKYYLAANAQNNAGTGRSDTVEFVTRVQVDLLSAVNAFPGKIDYSGSYTWDDAAPSSTGLVWGLESNLSDGDTILTALGVGGAYSDNLSSLPVGTYIYFLPYATNAAGTSYGDTIVKATLPRTTTLEATYPSPGSANLNGEAEYGNAAPTSVGFLFDYDASVGDGDLYTSTLQTDSSWSYSMNLDAGTIAYYAARSVNDGGQHYGASKTVVILAGVAVDSATAITNNEAALSASFDFNNVAIDSVGIKLSTNTDLSASTDTVLTLAADSTIAATMEGLTRYTDYYYTAFAGHNNLLAQGDTLSFRTAPDIPVLNLAFDVNADELQSKVTDPGGPLPDSVYFKWSSFSDLSDPLDTVVTYNAMDSTFAAVIDVLSGSDYYAVAYAANSAGTGYSDTLHFATKLEVTTNPSLANTTDTTAVLQGSVFYRTQYAAPDSIGFRITHEGNSTDHWFSADLMQADSTFAFEFDFNFEEEYAFRALAKNAHDGTAVGDEILFCAGSCPEQLSYRGIDYGVVRIGCHCYFSENLATETYVNGDSILRVTNEMRENSDFYEALEIGAFRDFGNDSIKQSIGYHYNVSLVAYDFQSINRKVCPPGWHVMTVSDYQYITPYVNAAPYALHLDDDPELSAWEVANAQINSLKSSSADTPPFDGSNQFGFSVIPNGRINSVGDWISEERGVLFLGGANGAGDLRFLPNPVSGNNFLNEFRPASGFYKNEGGGIRCVADDQPSAPFIYSSNATETSSTSAVLHGWLGFVGWETSSIAAELNEIGFIVASDTSFADSTIYPTTLLPSDSIEYQLNGLVEGQEYWFKAYATNEFGTAFSTTRSFIAMTATEPTVTTLPMSHMVTEEYGKTYFTAHGIVNDKNNGEILSAGWKWSLNPDLSDAVDSVEVAGYHEGVEDLVLNLDTIFSVEIDQVDAEPSIYTLLPGETYHFVAFATNEYGTGYGDTLNHYVPMVVRSSAQDHTDSTITINGLVKYGDTPPTSMSLVWSVDQSSSVVPGKETFSEAFITNYDSLCANSGVPTENCTSFAQQDLATLSDVANVHWADAYKPSYLTYESQTTFKYPTDTVSFTLEADSTFSVTIDIADSISLETPFNWQIVYENAAGTYRSGKQGTTTGGCFDLEAEGFTYHLVKIGRNCWFAENLRTEFYENGDSIPYLAWPSEHDPAWANAKGNGGAQSFKDSLTLASDGRVYTAATLMKSDICPTGTSLPTKEEAATSLDDTDGDYLQGNSGIRDNLEKHKVRDYHEYHGPGLSGLNLPDDGTWTVLGYTSNVYPGQSEGPARIWAKPVYAPHSDTWTGYLYRMYLADDVAPTMGGGRVTYWDLESNQGFTTGQNLAFPARCIAENNLEGPRPASLSATNISDSTITLNGTLTFKGWRGTTETGFMYADNPSFSNATTTWTTDIDGSFSVPVTGLNGGTIYYRPVAKGHDGNIAYGDTESSCLINCNAATYNGHTYQTTIIGCDCWFAENLRSDVFNDGTPIPGGLDDATWLATTTPAQAIYDGDSATYFNDYGRLYNLPAFNADAGLCPTGWHVSTQAEFNALVDNFGGQTTAAEELKASASDSPSWDGTNTSGFSMLPGGKRDAVSGAFDEVGTAGYFFLKGESDNMSRQFSSGSDAVTNSGTYTKSGYSVRCVRDTMSAPVVTTAEASSLTDTTATLNGSVDFNWGAMSATGFKWGLQSDLSDATDVSGDTLAGDFSADLTGSVNDTIYYVAFATNELGTTYGDTLSFIFVPEGPCEFVNSFNYDGHDYELVEIGNQCWFAENLRNDNYADGTPIPGNLSAYDWINDSTGTGAQAIYNDDSLTYYADYGRLYNWFAVDNTAGLCPSGWHVPTRSEFDALEAFLGVNTDGNKLKSSNTDSPPWDGSNETGFSAVPAGMRHGDYASYILNGEQCSFWISDDDSIENGRSRLFKSVSWNTQISSNIKRQGNPVRCLRNTIE